MKVRHIPGFIIWLNQVQKHNPEYNDVKYFNRLFALYTKKFK